MAKSTTGDSNTPASKPSTFAEIIGTGYFHPQLRTGNVHDEEATSSSDGNLNLPDNRPNTFPKLVGTGIFRPPLRTGNIDNDEVTGSSAGELNPPEPASPSTFLEPNETENFFRQSKNDEESSKGGKKASAGTRLNVFPPLLTSLNRNGRPRFNLEKVRDGDRLVIRQVPNDWPEVVRDSQGNGRVKMMLAVDGGNNDSQETERLISLNNRFLGMP